MWADSRSRREEVLFCKRTHYHTNRYACDTSKFVKNVQQTKVAEAVAKACRQGYKNIMSLGKGTMAFFALS